MKQTLSQTGRIDISVQYQDLNQAEVYQRLQQNSQAGALIVFVGLVRDLDDNTPTSGMVLEHYPGMTEKVLREIVEQACARWAILQCELIHRVGELARNEQIICLGLATSHRADGFEAAQFIMDLLKTQAPFWKKERFDGKERWVEMKASDIKAATRWSVKSE